MKPGRTHRWGKLLVLVGLLAFVGYPGAAAGGLCFGFLLCRVALCFGLVLLGPALASEVISTTHSSDGFLDPSLDVLDDALDGFRRSGLVGVRHE